MKKVYFPVFIFLTTFTCKAQDYIPFPDSNATWKVVVLPYPPGPIIWYAQHYDYILSEDTIILGQQYSKLLKKDYNVECSQIFTGPYYYGGIRNDTMNKKVYYFPYDQNQEFLLYDFDLEIGDTVPQTWNNYSYPDLYVDAIDSTYINNSYRKRYIYLEQGYDIGIGVIEGIGAETGLLEPIEMFEVIWYLRCFYQNDSIYYINSNFTTSCNLEIDTCLNVSISEIHNPTTLFVVYPNPCRDIFIIDFSFDNLPAQAYYSISDPLGRIIEEGAIQGQQNQIIIRTSSFSSGLHTIRLIVNGKVEKALKLNVIK